MDGLGCLPHIRQVTEHVRPGELNRNCGLSDARRLTELSCGINVLGLPLCIPER